MSVPHRYGKSMQFAWVVDDLEEAIQYWSRLGVGPFVVFEENLTADRTFTHRGVPSGAQILVGLSYLGDSQIELIQQTNSEPSTYKELLDTSGPGFHHISFWPDDCDAAVENYTSEGWKVVAQISSNGVAGATYLENPADPKQIVEFAPPNAMRKAYFDKIKQLCDTWDGSNPVRRYRTRADFLAS